MRVPKLRFKEFSGEWEEKRLGEVSLFINEKTKLSDITLENYISTENLLTDFLGVIKASKLPNILNVTKFKKNDILISNIRPYLKKIWLSNIEGGASNDIIVIRVKENNNYKFLTYIVQNDKFINYVMRGAKGVKMPRGDIALIKKYPLFIPPLHEQQKIASTLSSLDNLIQAQSKKVEALKKYKKGLMQKLFPQEGEKKPKLRFKEFSGEWEEKRLGDICKIFKGKQLNRDTLSNNDLYPVINGGVEPSGYTNKYNKKSNTITISEGGNSCGYINFIDKDFWLGGHCYSLEESKVDKFFLYQLLKSNEINIMRLRVGSGLPNIQKKDLDNYLLKVPKSIQEQQKIASTLSSLDNLIEAQSKKVEALKKHKKGLLQQMFVSGEE